MKTALDQSTGRIDWAKFFDNQSVYKLLYTLQIVEAVMEEGEDEGREVIVVEEEIKKKVPQAPPLPGATPRTADGETTTQTESVQEDKAEAPPVTILNKRGSVIVENEDEDRKLKSEWTKMFLEHNGFGYILQVFMQKEINVDNTTPFDLKHIAFLLKLLRIFIMASFSTSSESSIFTDT